MINLTNLNRQHETIMEEIDVIETELRKGRTGVDCSNTALHINKLAGQLRIHLLEEDKFLYPNLLESADHEMKGLADQYIGEMGNLAAEFTNFKNKYNIPNKIKQNLDAFLTEGEGIVSILKNRIMKENKGLYQLIKEKSL